MIRTYGVDYLTWEVIENHHLEKTFTFPDFIQALDFVNKAGQVCEEHDHHAEFILSWGSVCVRTWSLQRYDLGDVLVQKKLFPTVRAYQ